MSELIHKLVGQRVFLTSTDGVMVATDEGILDAYDERIVRLRKDDDNLYFPRHNVQDIMPAVENQSASLPFSAHSAENLLSELVGEKLHVFPNPHILRVDGKLEAVDDQVICLRTLAGSRNGLEHTLYQPLTRIRLIKPAR